MGLHPMLKPTVIEALRKHAPQALGVESSDGFFGNPERSADISDYLIHFRALPTVKRYSLVEIANNMVKQCLMGNRATVILCDDKRQVPNLKAGEQADRIAAQNASDEKNGLDEAVPYPFTAQFCCAGVVVVHEFIDDNGNPAEKEGKPEPVCIRRLGRSAEQVRRRAWDQLFVILMHQVACISAKLPFQSVVTFDYDHQRLRCLVTVPNTQGCEVVERIPTHQLGESDTAAFYHLYRLEQRGMEDESNRMTHVNLRSADSDWFGIYAFYHVYRRPEWKQRTKVLWHTRNGVLNVAAQAAAAAAAPSLAKGKRRATDSFDPRETGLVLDLGLTMEVLSEIVFKCPIKTLAEGFPLAKHDFLDEDLYRFGKGWEAVMDAYIRASTLDPNQGPSIKRFRIWLVELWKPVGEGSHTVKSLRASFTTKHQLALAAHAKKPKKAVPANATHTEKRKIEKDNAPPVLRFPTDEAIRQQAAKWMWICEYGKLAHTGQRPRKSPDQIIAEYLEGSELVPAPSVRAAESFFSSSASAAL